MLPKKGLGKGLAALIHTPARRPEVTPAALAAAEPAPGERIRQVALDQVVTSPFQPRKHLREEQLLELVESIREHGLIQPLIVREVAGKFELIAGERRWRACSRLELKEVPIIVRTASDRDVLELALIENLQREDLNPIEEAEAYSRLAREFHLKQEEIAQRVGKNRATVANAMRLLELTETVKSLLANGQLSVGHAKVVLALKDPTLQTAAAEEILKKGLTVRATEALVASASKTGAIGSMPAGKKSPGGGRNRLPEIGDIEERLRERLATKVVIHHGEKKGRIEIEYYGNPDLDRLLTLLGLPSRYEML